MRDDILSFAFETEVAVGTRGMRDATSFILHHSGYNCGRVAQLAEQLTLNQRVEGSSPSTVILAPSSSGPGYRPLKAETRVRVPLGLLSRS